MEQSVVTLLIFSIFGFFLLLLFLASKQVLSIFPSLNSVKILFHEKGATGYSNNSLIAKAGGASGVLEIVVTENELWFKTSAFFGLFAKMYNLIHRINRNDLIRITKISKNRVEVDYKNKGNREEKFTVKLKNAEAFMVALRQVKNS